MYMCNITKQIYWTKWFNTRNEHN